MSAAESHSILKAEDLTIGYSTKKLQTVVASHINIELKQGELVGLIGANGVGKSTLIRTLTNVQKPLRESVFINDKNTKQFNPIDLAKVMSLVLTEQIASKNLTVFEVIALGRQPYTGWIGNLSENDKTIINKAITQTNIENFRTFWKFPENKISMSSFF